MATKTFAGKILNNDNGDVALDMYHRYKVTTDTCTDLSFSPSGVSEAAEPNGVRVHQRN